MLFSAHVVDSSPIAALRRRTPQAGDVPGLRSARNGIAAPFTRGVLPRPQLRREVLLAGWDDEAALDRFLTDDPSGRVFADGWELRMELHRAVGVWPGLDAASTQEAAAEGHEGDGPSVAITIGTAYARTLVPFMRVNSGLEDQFLDTPSGLWGTALSNIPQRLVATLTVWESGDAAIDYMRSGAHGAAASAHYDPKKDPTGHTFVTGGGFLGFRPLSSRGSVGGKNPISPSIIGL
ncbi:MAG: hypothetical protein RIB98_11905 [Acidimicrobiales bacterium]